MFEKEIRPVSDVAMNILKKRYFQPNENTWKELVDRVSKAIYPEGPEGNEDFYNLLLNRYFVLNSPALVNLGTNNNGGAMACFVLPFEDTIEDIYETKKNFALIARKGGGCGTTLSDIRPEGSKVHGSSHGYAGGPIKFADTISHDMHALTQSGFREMAIMLTMSVYHPDIMKFISAKYNESDKKIENANISVVVDNAFMTKVANDETYWTEFNGQKYEELPARKVFEAIVEGIWRNGEPGLLFSEAINDSPYKYTGQFIKATNP